MREFNKIFQTGNNKTGTRSLALALKKLGITTIHGFSAQGGSPKLSKTYIWDNKMKGLPVLTGLENYRAFTDYPFLEAKMLKVYEKQYTNSLFIKLTRDPQDWFWSIYYHIERAKLEGREDLWSQFKDLKEFLDNKDKHIKKFFNREEKVEAFFNKIEQDRYLIMNICKGDGWELLCPFLEIDIPNIKFPWEGKGDYEKYKKDS